MTLRFSVKLHESCCFSFDLNLINSETIQFHYKKNNANISDLHTVLSTLNYNVHFYLSMYSNALQPKQDKNTTSLLSQKSFKLNLFLKKQ